MRQVLGEEATPRTRLVELPGRGVTRVWECAGPPGAETLMLIHGVACTAELNWGKVFAPLAAHFRVVAADLRGHGDGIRAGARFRLEDCANDVAALAAVLGTGKFTAVGVGGRGDPGILGRRLHHRDVAPAFDREHLTERAWLYDICFQIRQLCACRALNTRSLQNLAAATRVRSGRS